MGVGIIDKHSLRRKTKAKYGRLVSELEYCQGHFAASNVQVYEEQRWHYKIYPDLNLTKFHPTVSHLLTHHCDSCTYHAKYMEPFGAESILQTDTWSESVGHIRFCPLLSLISAVSIACPIPWQNGASPATPIYIGNHGNFSVLSSAGADTSYTNAIRVTADV